MSRCYRELDDALSRRFGNASESQNEGFDCVMVSCSDHLQYADVDDARILCLYLCLCLCLWSDGAVEVDSHGLLRLYFVERS